MQARLQTLPTLRLCVQSLGSLTAGFLLALAPVLEHPVPIALAFMGALPFGVPAVCAGIGATLGYLCVWGTAQAAELLASGALILAGSCLLGAELPKKTWAKPVLDTSLYFAVAFVFLLDRRPQAMQLSLFAVRLALLPICSMAFSDLRGDGVQVLALGLLAGVSRIRLFCVVSLAVPLAAAAVLTVCERKKPPVRSALCGLCLDAAIRPSLPMTAVFLLADLCCRGMRLPVRALQGGELFAVCAAASFLLEKPSGSLLLGIGLGAGLYCLIPKECLEAEPPAVTFSDGQADRLNAGAALLQSVCQMLDRTAVRDLEPSSAAVFDRAAEQICQNCGKWSICWGSRAENTYLALSRAANSILKQGSAARSDLPPFFLDQCCHLDGFLTAVNEELDEELSRRRYDVRLRETRTIVSDQFRFLSRLLTMLSEQPNEPEPLAAFDPELGLRIAGRTQSSGDSSSSFRRGAWYYLLLCDGMGTGAEAERESKQAQELIEQLSKLGFDAQDALQILNELYILRGDGVFSTVDLLQLDLVSGEGYLYKWGAAPSYLISENGAVQTLGTATTPPGLGVEGCRQGECIRLSLREGELLVLMSDGVDNARALELLPGAAHMTPRQTANALVMRGNPADDRSAAALRLHPAPNRLRQTKKKPRILSGAGG